jgi:hypothetical protein
MLCCVGVACHQRVTFAASSGVCLCALLDGGKAVVVSMLHALFLGILQIPRLPSPAHFESTVPSYDRPPL